MPSYHLLWTKTILYLLLFETTKTGQSIDCGSMPCKRSYILCVDNENCDINCSSVDQACQSSIVVCPENGDCNIQCDSRQSCDKMIIHAQKSNTLTLSCQNHTESCYFMDVYCPQNKGLKTCNVSGFDGFFEMAIYALNGFNDIHFDIATSLSSTTIHCSSNITTSSFDESCVVSPIFPHSHCINNVTHCYPDLRTISPSIIPTSAPTVSTQNPSIFPTISPTSFPTINPSPSPTSIPSISPTMKPSISPTTIPTLSPMISTTITASTTEYPSIYPTIYPTDFPTDFPTVFPTPEPTKIPTFKPTQSSTGITSQTPTSKPTRKYIRYHLMTSSETVDIEYNNDTNIDRIQTNIKPITIDLTNLLYVILGTVFMCCVVCGLCFVKNNLFSNRNAEHNRTKWSDWNNQEFIFRNALNSGSSDVDSRSNRMNRFNDIEEEDDDDVLDGMTAIHEMMDEKNDSSSDCGSQTLEEINSIVTYINSFNMDQEKQIKKRKTSMKCGLGESYTMEHDDDDNKVNDDEFCKKLVDYIIDEKILTNSIINDVEKDIQ